MQEPLRVRADYTTDALVVFGIAVSGVFIGGSALLNYRMGFTSANNAADGIVYGILAAAGDGLKVLSPFIAAYGWRHRDWLATIAATAVFIIFTAYSFTSALGFSSQHRATKEGNAATLMERHRDARDTLDRDRRTLDALGPQRPSAEISQAIDSQLHAPVGSGRWTVDQVSDGCRKNTVLTRTACETVSNLKEELARARSAEDLAADIKTLTDQLAKSKAPVTTDAQTDALTFLGRLLHVLPRRSKQPDDGKEAGFDLALLMAIFIELGSGLGLYIATTPWRMNQNDGPKSVLAPALPPMISGPPLEIFAADRLEMKRGHQLHLAVAFESYKDWCEERNRPMLGRARFERGLLKLAEEVGLAVKESKSGWMICDMAVRRVAASRRV